MSAESSALLDPEGLVGRVLAERYLIEERLGEGGMGMVYRATHVKMGRSFAVKILHPELLRNEKVVWRFDREADAAARMRHPNVVPALDVGTTEEGLRYLVMDFVDGPDLATLMQEAPMPPPRVIWLVRQILDGLQHAHHHGLIHRDLKPQNIIVECDADGREIPRIVDFGISILATEAEEDESSRLTTNGMVLGTPLYMAPEQAVAGDIDHRVDLFALGLICYEMLSGALPFDGTGAQVARANLMLDPPPMSRRVPDLSVDPLLEAFTRRLMERDRDRRPASARDARELLDLIERDRRAAAAALSVTNDAQPSKVLTVPRLPSVAPDVPSSSPSIDRQALGAAATELSARHKVRAASPLVMVQEEGSEVVVSLSPLGESGPAAAPVGHPPGRAISLSDGVPYDGAVPPAAMSGDNPVVPGSGAPFPLPYFPGDPPPMVAQPWQGHSASQLERREQRYATTDHHGYRHYGEQRRRWVVVGSLGVAVAGIAIAVIVMVSGKPSRGPAVAEVMPPPAVDVPPETSPPAPAAEPVKPAPTEPSPVAAAVDAGVETPPPGDASSTSAPVSAPVSAPASPNKARPVSDPRPPARPIPRDKPVVDEPVIEKPVVEKVDKPPIDKPTIAKPTIAKPPIVASEEPASDPAAPPPSLTSRYTSVGNLIGKLPAVDAKPLWDRYRRINKDRAAANTELRDQAMAELAQLEKEARALLPRK